MSEITRVGVDLAKNVIQVHAVDAAEKVITNKALQRDKFILWCAMLPARCLRWFGSVPPVGGRRFGISAIHLLLY